MFVAPSAAVRLSWRKRASSRLGIITLMVAVMIATLIQVLVSAQGQPAPTPAASAANDVSGSWALRRVGELTTSSSLTLSVDGRRLSATGPGWSGTGEFNGRSGYYDWTFTSGQKGRTELVLDEQGLLRGKVRGSGPGMNWDFIGISQRPVNPPAQAAPAASSTRTTPAPVTPPPVTAAGTPAVVGSSGTPRTAPSPDAAPVSRSPAPQANVTILREDDVLRGLRAVSLQADVRGRNDIPEANIIKNTLTPTLSAVGLSIVDAGPNVPTVTLTANMLYGDPAWAHTVAIELRQLLPASPQPNAPLIEAVTWRRAKYGLAGGLVVNGVVRRSIQEIVNEFAAAYRGVNQGGPALSSQTAKPATPLAACVAWGSQKPGGATTALPWCQCMIAGLNSEPSWWAPNLQLMMSDFGAAYGRLVTESPDLARRVMNACNR